MKDEFQSLQRRHLLKRAAERTRQRQKTLVVVFEHEVQRAQQQSQSSESYALGRSPRDVLEPQRRQRRES